MKQLFTLMALLLTSVTFGQETCNNVFDYNDNNTIDIEDFLAILGLFADVDLDDDGTWDSLDNCLDLSACNYASELNEPCTYLPPGDCDCNGNVLDECGVCGGTGLAPGTCDCNGTLIDVIGVCGGDCWADEDADGICDDVDECVGEYDACDVCNGPGAIYECGCANIPEGECDCDGNVLDAIGVCGGACSADEDADGVCDDVDDCVGEFDVCGVCNGPGEVYECGCSDVPEGECDCEGNVLDALGECGGECLADEDGDGVCDDVDDCVGEFDECGVCNGDGAVYECGCNDIPEGECDCDGNVFDECGVCNGPGPTEIVIEDIVTYYDSVYLPFDDAWYVYPVDADTTFGFTCAPSFQGCGDPVSYQGYDYSTVQIGEQCWFAENLRNEQYANGDSIPSDLSEEVWSTTSSGAVAIYGDEAGYCDHYSLVFNACDELQALEEYGRLYNWFAVVDARNLCPSGWHVSTDEDWMDLEIALGMNDTELNNSGWRGTTQGSQLKATYGWDGGCNGPSFDHECNGGGNGTNSTGFSALPGGRRGSGIQPYDFAGGNGMWWSPVSSNNSETMYRMMDYGDNIYRSSPAPAWGYSVRCIQSTPEVLGCIDPSACNYNLEATQNDGSCEFASCVVGCMIEIACNYNPEAALPDNSCDFISCQGCTDTAACNYDTTATIEDGSCEYDSCPSFEACGDPMSYQGYDYATVQIGNQCWFAENLRSESYSNGDAIEQAAPYGWDALITVYGTGIDCSSSAPNGNACDPLWSLQEYGRLYAFWAINDSRGVCPNNWHVPSETEWTVMTDYLGGSQHAGVKMKSQSGWSDNGNGNNESGFSGRPGGQGAYSAESWGAGLKGEWWTSSQLAEGGFDAYFKRLQAATSECSTWFDNPSNLRSVRCIQNTEE